MLSGVSKTEVMGTRFFIVDDNIFFRKTFGEFLKNVLKHEVVGEASSSIEALQDSRLMSSDIVVMDIMMQELDGISPTKKLLWNFPSLKVLAVTSEESHVFLQQLINAGFFGCVLKGRLFEEFEIAIEHLIKGKRYFSNVMPF